MLNMYIAKSLNINLLVAGNEKAMEIERKVLSYNSYQEKGLKHPSITLQEHIENELYLNRYYSMLVSL
ncbi:MAG: hypothetical protein ACRCXT_15495 [Paraclostridium sp.]